MYLEERLKSANRLLSRAVHLLEELALVYVDDKETLERILYDSERNRGRAFVREEEVIRALEDYIAKAQAGI